VYLSAFWRTLPHCSLSLHKNDNILASILWSTTYHTFKSRTKWLFVHLTPIYRFPAAQSCVEYIGESFRSRVLAFYLQALEKFFLSQEICFKSRQEKALSLNWTLPYSARSRSPSNSFSVITNNLYKISKNQSSNNLTTLVFISLSISR